MNVRFQCGCLHEVTADWTTFDGESFIVCPEHSVRRYGWRSIGRNHSMASLSAIQVERSVVFGEIPAVHENTNTFIPTVPDMRDNRDPEIAWVTQESRPYIVGPQLHDEDFDEAQRHRSAQEARKRLGLRDLRDTSLWPSQAVRIPHNGSHGNLK